KKMLWFTAPSFQRRNTASQRASQRDLTTIDMFRKLPNRPPATLRWLSLRSIVRKNPNMKWSRRMERSSLPVAIIGAGPVGLAAAAHLVQAGETPLVLEAGAAIG